MSGVKQLPEFQTEAEEARWYYEHREELQDYLEPEPETDVPLHVRLDLPPRQKLGLLRIRMLAPDVERARRLAARRGMSLQAFVDELLREALDREEAQAA